MILLVYQSSHRHLNRCVATSTFPPFAFLSLVAIGFVFDFFTGRFRRFHRIRIVRHHRQGSDRGGTTTGSTTTNSKTRTTTLPSAERNSEKEREGHSDNNGTVSFLRLPILILGGRVVECSVLHPDTVVEI